MLKLINPLQHYDWGSKTALTQRFGIPNPDNKPIAEMWMGAHPKSSSLVNINGKTGELREWIQKDPVKILGEAVANRFGELPFLFKILTAAQPLSIQVHPAKHAARAGFAKENAQNIPMDSPTRNYKDANHKPELVYALTPFFALNGFRSLSETQILLKKVQNAHPEISRFLENPDFPSLKTLFSALLLMNKKEKNAAITILNQVLEEEKGQPWQTIKFIAKTYPEDSGLFAPLFLNVVELQPGQAMFLYAQTPHAYLKGMALEIMANSDNVLRAGLTSKHIDIPELMSNTTFQESPYQTLITPPAKEKNTEYFPVPVEDFAFSIHQLEENPFEINQKSAAIFLCTEGEAWLKNKQETQHLHPGESCFVAVFEFPLEIKGKGRLACACTRHLSTCSCVDIGIRAPGT